jgi:hypothetical protein
MKTKNTSCISLKAPTLLFISALTALCSVYERELNHQTMTHAHTLKTKAQLQTENRELSRVLEMLGGYECSLRLRGIASLVDTLTRNLEDAYMDAAYCDQMDDTIMRLNMEILELESELGRL